MRRALLAVVVAFGLVAVPAPPAQARRPAAIRPFTVTVHSAPVFGIQPPEADPARQTHVVAGAGGTDVYVETWLPAPLDGAVPPARVPTIVSISPYLTPGSVESTFILETMVPRGYAYANVHVRGTGASGGCIDLGGPLEADDSARAVEYVGRDAPWSDGTVGAYGVSYPGGTILSVAGRGDPVRTQYLKAVISGAPFNGIHEAQWTFDGVPSFLTPTLMPLSYALQSLGFSLPPAWMPPPLDRIPPRLGCLAVNIGHGLDWSGNHTPWHQARDNRAWASSITVPTFIFHGHPDLLPVGGSPPSTEVGLFDQIPASTPHVGLFGNLGHGAPDRADFTAMVVAWFDHWVRGIDSDVDEWPVVQVQGNDGRWRAEPNWPDTGGPEGRLHLGSGVGLAGAPTGGTTAYTEALFETTSGMVPGTFAVFETPPLAAGLELTGQPVLDLWVSLSISDAHIAARIDTFDAAGLPIANGHTYGLRSARHLAPFQDGRFVQARPVLPPVRTPILVPVRFQPTDLVVPAGGRVRITIAGSLIVNPGLSQFGIPEPLFLGPSQPSGVPTRVTILHDAAHPSALRFLQPGPDPDYLAIAS